MAENKKPNLRIIYMGTLIVALLCVGVSYYLQQQQANKEALQAEQQRQEDEAAAQKLVYQSIMDDMLKNLTLKADIYKQKRNLLREMIKPDNFASPDGAQKTFDFFTTILTPDLRKASAEVMDVFTACHDRIYKELKDHTGALKEEFMQGWAAVEKEQVAQYVDFFEREEQDIAHHKDLVTFYYKYSKRMSVDPATGKATFTHFEDAREEKRLLMALEHDEKTPDK